MKPKPFFKPLLRVMLFTACLQLASCSKYDPYQYTVSAINLFNADKSGARPVTNTTGIVSDTAYALQVQYTTYISAREGHIVPFESGFALEYKTTTCQVTSTTDFDRAHPAGSSLNDLFTVELVYNNPGWQPQQWSFADAFAKQYLFIAYSPSGGDTDKPWTSNLFFLLMKPPATPGYRTFVLQTAFSNNTQFTDSISVTLR